MSERSFHHGNLRAELLDKAEKVLRERGIGALSLRELAREAGVSHGAPRNHFVDRAALLDALAERGFLRLADELRQAGAGASGDFRGALQSAATAYVAFAVREPALLELMFAAKADDPPDAVRTAAASLFETITQIMQAGADTGAYPASDLGSMSLLVAAAAQGTATLVAARRITAEQGDAVIRDAIQRLIPLAA